MVKPRSFACAVATLALVVAAPAVHATASTKRKHHVWHFGTRPLAKGAKGKDVRYLQRSLSRLGVATSIDGVCGKGTFRSVEAFEQQHGWPVNGVISKKDARRIKKLLVKRRVSGSYFIQGYVRPTLQLTSRKAGGAKVKVLDSFGNLVQTITVDFEGAGSKSVSWDGMQSGGGVAGDGIYLLKLADGSSAGASIAGGQTQPFAMHLHMFPVPGPHTYAGPDGRFGAPRSGHVHQGQDVPAACGSKLYVVETGSVRVNAYQASGAGYYVVLHGILTGTDFVYMHLKVASWAPVGTSVYAGQQIGKVGETGDAEGCHLHFERWSVPGWYVGGAPYDPLPELQYWDSYS